MRNSDSSFKLSSVLTVILYLSKNVSIHISTIQSFSLNIIIVKIGLLFALRKVNRLTFWRRNYFFYFSTPVYKM